MEETDQEHGPLEVEAGSADNVANNPHGCVNCVSEMEVMQEMVGNDGEKMADINGLENLAEIETSSPKAVKCEIPVIFPASVSGSGNDCEEKAIEGQMNVKKNGKEGKKDKCSKRWAKGMKVSDGNGKHNLLSLVSEARNNLKRGDGSKINYSRNELEALRFVNVEGQRIMWNEIYHRLGPCMARELKGMADTKHQRQGSRNVEHHRGIVKKKEHFAVLSEACSQDLENDFTELNPLDLSCGDYVNSNDNHSVIEDEYTEDGDSDNDCDNIQRRAFLVEGEPDFESGPPQDGLEYLRRVRWEAAHIPKVKVAKLDRSKLTNDPIVYMPKIPDIAKCPEHLLPMKLWEDDFLADFSDLRMALSQMGSGDPRSSAHLQSFLNLVEDDSCQQRRSMGLQTSNDLQSLVTAEDDTSLHFETSCPKNSESAESILMDYEEDTSQPIESCTLGTSGKHQSICDNNNLPALSVILRMTPVSRASMLRKHIDSFETAGHLSRNNCEWLFALCAAIDTPLDADMCASMRCLLRKCASLRAEKCEVDDEVVMLNILVTISGKYFGQSEN